MSEKHLTKTEYVVQKKVEIAEESERFSCSAPATGYVLGDYNVWYQKCEHCGYDPGQTYNNRCWKCGRKTKRDFSNRALKLHLRKT